VNSVKKSSVFYIKFSKKEKEKDYEKYKLSYKVVMIGKKSSV
jgi:hypothetical protein